MIFLYVYIQDKDPKSKYSKKSLAEVLDFILLNAVLEAIELYTPMSKDLLQIQNNFKKSVCSIKSLIYSFLNSIKMKYT